MNSNAERLLLDLLISPWVAIALFLLLALTWTTMRRSLTKRRAARRAADRRRYWRDKFESELPQILQRNRDLQAMTGVNGVLLLSHDKPKSDDPNSDGGVETYNQSDAEQSAAATETLPQRDTIALPPSDTAASPAVQEANDASYPQSEPAEYLQRIVNLDEHLDDKQPKRRRLTVSNEDDVNVIDDLDLADELFNTPTPQIDNDSTSTTTSDVRRLPAKFGR